MNKKQTNTSVSPLSCLLLSEEKMQITPRFKKGKEFLNIFHNWSLKNNKIIAFALSLSHENMRDVYRNHPDCRK